MPVHKRHASKRHVHRHARRGHRARRTKLTKRQLMQRKFAAKMQTIRARARRAGRGVGRILKSSAAQKLRRKYGLRNPYAKR